MPAIRVLRRKRRQTPVNTRSAQGGPVYQIDNVARNAPVPGQTTIDLAGIVTGVVIDKTDLTELAACKLYDRTDLASGQCVDIIDQGGGVVQLVFDFVTNVAQEIDLYIPQLWKCLYDLNGSPIHGSRDSRVDSLWPDLGARGSVHLRQPV